MQISGGLFLHHSLLCRTLATSSHLSPEFWYLSYQFSMTTVLCLGSPSPLCGLEIASRKKSRTIIEFTSFISFLSQVVLSYVCVKSENTFHIFLSSFLGTYVERINPVLVTPSSEV